MGHFAPWEVVEDLGIGALKFLHGEEKVLNCCLVLTDLAILFADSQSGSVVRLLLVIFTLSTLHPMLYKSKLSNKNI